MIEIGANEHDRMDAGKDGHDTSRQRMARMERWPGKTRKAGIVAGTERKQYSTAHTKEQWKGGSARLRRTS